jgi:hypothetical protein
MWLAIPFIIYCVLCWLLAFLLVQFVWRRVLIDLAAKAGIPLLLLVIIAILTAPVVLPYLLTSSIPCILQLRQERQMLNRINRTYRPYEFIKINSLFVGPSIRELFEFHTPSLVQLGFTLVGDYRMKPEPVEVHDRLFWSADGEILASICALLDSGAVSLISVLADGTCIHTCCVADPHPERTFEPADQLVISYLPDRSPADLYQHHVSVLRECSADHETGVMRFREGQFREVLIYDQLIFCRWRYRYGGLDEDPPAPDFGSLQSPQVEPAQ